MSAHAPLHDWICDGCGKKLYGQRKVPTRRCHGYPLRPMGPPWNNAADTFYAHAKTRPGWGSRLADNYWVSEAVLTRLQKICDEQGLKWSASVRRRDDSPDERDRYEDLP